ncbi:MAG: hypothetical protein GC150_15165 [Rhizobiales bacterium]|nr:hypothetical protein [Hyphomicrobiales bacterium]
MRLTAVLGAGRELSGVGRERALLATFAFTLFLSASLLFSVQPMFAKMVLPKLGGSPSVWAIAMCFFQAMLLAGYLYAHALNRHFEPRHAALVHLSVMAFAFLALPIAIPAAFAAPPAGNAYFWVIGLFATAVGLPFFAVSANAPLLQSWFARSGHPDAADPYFLYGASNLGSMASLLAYPFLVEPVIGLSAQSLAWTFGFVALGALIYLSVVLAAGGQAAPGPRAAALRSRFEVAPAVAPSRIVAWIALAFVPSGLLVAFTTHLTTDIASAPFLWVIPLALFLATFVIVFRETPLVPMRWLVLAQPVLVAIELFALSGGRTGGWVLGASVGLAAFLVTTLVAHRVLYERRPAVGQLTDFYLWMSFGGVLGGVFAALVAPQVFDTVFEYPLLLVLGLACRPGIVGSLAGLRTALAPGGEARRLVLLVALAALALLALGLIAEATGAKKLLGLRFAAGLTLGLAMIALWRHPSRQLAAGVLMAVAIAFLPSNTTRGEVERSFFGVHRVMLSEDGKLRLLFHGTTVHGAERILDEAGKPTAVPVPATYYHAAGPMAAAIGAAREIASGAGRSGEFAVIGLGAGSLACYARREEAWRFYEIDPVVAAIARDPARFRFLSHCRPDADIVLGDARLTVAGEADAGLDLLVVDAFSSDSIPVHLLTVEAFELYLAKLAPTGVLALHISNRHLNLRPVLASVLAHYAGQGVEGVLFEGRMPAGSMDAVTSVVVMAARDPATIARLEALDGAEALPPGSPEAAWTDDHSDILGALLAKR